MKQDGNPALVGVRAVDVGYFNVKYTRGRKRVGDSSRIEVGLFPALAPQLALGHTGGTGLPAADVCAVTVGGVRYAVGTGAVYHTGPSEPRPIDPDYCATDKYHALTIGALHHMCIDTPPEQTMVLDLLVLGLPLNNYARHAATLAARMRGEHLLATGGAARSRRVVVKNVHVMVQPHGALCHFGAMRADLEGWTLVVDAGGGTLDWFLAQGQQPNWKRSGAYPKAMLHCAYAVADCIDAAWRHQYEVVEAIDRALRCRATRLRVGAREIALAAYRPAIDAVLQESVKAMLDATGPLNAVRRILLTGGGAGVYREYLARTMPMLAGALELDEDPVFSNVRGFQVCGEVLQQARRTP